MRAVKLVLKASLVLIVAGVAGVALLLFVFGWSSSRAQQENGECSMLVLEKKIAPITNATEYHRACMASKGYGMQPSCYIDNFTGASCFIPRWMFWINKV
ncbi:hypothetical protein B5K03_08755 [Rhizobium phaseoli]|uniref:hypothetical protein n=1 Tax=Rhizobium phaseoli TaxID=396 RepID=UPI000D67EBA7|nr:hypothetical protein [Rhizobium phaseoli]PWI54800.1 hypothetical protein B5K03_08755 [Rhizobium phaseoli]